MDELVAQVAGSLGLDPGVARKGVVIILKFLQKESPGDSVNALVAAIPGAAEAMAAAPPVSGGGVMGVFGDLTGAGLGFGDVQGLAKEFLGFARGKVGAPAVDAVVGSIPGLSQFT
ncbi:MAG: DUF2267 domain-containing protein [Bauldia sp.]